MNPVAVNWFDQIKTCIQWIPEDQVRMDELCRVLGSDLTGVIEALAGELARLKGTEPLMCNARFVQRMHGALEEWLLGVLEGTFDDAYVQARWEFGQHLTDVDMTLGDIILLEGLARRQLFALTQKNLGAQDETLSAMIHTLDKALCLDMTVIHSSFMQTRDSEMERVLLNRFLEITGFSRSLYENLAEARGWSETPLRQSVSVSS